MLNLLKALRQDEYGVILSAEIVIVGTLLVLGVITGTVCLQKSVNGELGDLAKAIDSIDQTYSYSGHRKAGVYGNSGGCCAFTAGSAFNNNECNTTCQNDLVGCEAQNLQTGNCGTCSTQCGTCGGQFGTAGICGSCGHLGAAVYRNPNRPNCVSTGVPNMKVTEYPGTDNVPRTSNEGGSPIRFPELEAQPCEPAFPQQMPVIEEHFVPEVHPHHQSGVQSEQPVYLDAQPHGPVPSNVPEPAESNESLRPIPETQPIPDAPPEPQA